VVFTKNHWEAAYLAPAIPLARGWERQVDRKVNSLFYEDEDGALNHFRYRTWLRRMCVRFIALPNAPLDYSARQEARLLRAGAGYLEPIHRSPRWRIWRVASMTPLSPTCDPG
jgi:hypothetical protein